MRTSRLIIVLVGFLFVTAIVATPAYMRSGFFAVASPHSSPPVANNDSYTKHGGGTIGPLLQNDYDPDGDAISVTLVTYPTHGTLSGINGNSFNYSLYPVSYLGTDSFTYKACQTGGVICSNVATVTLTFVNQAPVGGNESYPVHGSKIIGPLLANDSDADGDQLSWTILTYPAHGTIYGLSNPPYADDFKRYQVSGSYTGTDSFTYKVCDVPFNLCSAPVTVTLNISNNPPVPGPDIYVVAGSGIIGPMFINDSDPDGDSFNGPDIVVGAAHGTVSGLANPPYANDYKQYVGNTGFIGVDSFQYRITDFLGAYGTTTVYMFVLGDGINDGVASCNAGIAEPINVTNGNMYLQQGDYSLPGAGPGIAVKRTYNSNSQRIGLFGRGWSTAYDESVVSYDSSLVRFNQADGRAIYFSRPVGSSGAFAPLQGDFHAGLTQDANGFTLSLNDGSVKQFNTSGKLISLSDRNSNQTTLAYASGKLTSVTDAFGRVLSFTTNANGQVLTISDTMGTVATYTYGTANQLLSATYADNSRFQFVYNANYRLTSVTDALGNVLESHAYDAQGRALTSERQGGVERYTLNYVSTSQTEVTDALGRVTKYTIDKSKLRNVVTRVEGVCGCGGGGSQVQTWTYDNQLNVTAKIDALTHTTTFTYDANGNRLTETDATGTVTYTYNQFGEVLTRTDQMSGVTINTYDAQGNQLTTKDALNNTTTFTYDARGQLLTVTDPRNNTTTFTYDTSGNLTRRTDALNNQTNIAYDARGRITSATNALTQTTNYEYDLAGRLKKIIYPDTNFVLLTFDLAGRRTKVKDPRGYETTFAYDSAYRLTSETNADAKVTSYAYDLMSNLTGVTDALNRTTNYTYDDFNRVTKIKYPEATVGAGRLEENFTYDSAGNLLQKTDQTGRMTSFCYDSSNRLTSTTDPALKTTAFEYNARSQQTAVVDAINQRYEFVYDALGRRTQEKKGTATMSFVYDAAGNRNQRTDYNNAVTNYTYDALNRMTTISYPDTTSATYGYDALSRLTTGTNPNGTVTITYDNRSRVSSVTDVFGQVVSYAYDANSNRTQLNLNGATSATYQYDVINRLIQLADNASLNTTFAYDPTNKLTARTLPNGVVTTSQYDGLNRLTRLTHAKGANTLADFQYQFNTVNDITQMIDGAGSHNYSYDSLDRLTAATHPNQTNESYTYDDVGNRTASNQGSSYTYQPFNRLVASNGASFGYDANGNLISKTDPSGSWTYSWDYENRLKEASLSGGVTVGYNYDALGRRIQLTSTTGGVTKFVYDGSDVLRDFDGSGSVLADYLNGPGIDNKLRQTTGTTAAYFALNHLDTTRALTDASGNVSSALDYDSFGNVTSGAATTRFTYTGREIDPETGLMYYRARWYDPQVGRFTSEDPIGLVGGINSYAYVENNPLRFVDPSGLERLNYTMHPGQPPPPIPTNPIRLPDFYSLQINLGPPASPLGWSGQVMVDRHGRIYLQPLGFNLGKSFPAGASAAVTFGWINQRCEPDQKRLNDVLSDQSIGVGAGFFGGGEFTGNQNGSTTQIGVFTPQIGGSWGYAFPWKDTGLEQSHFSLECGCPGQ